IAFNDTNDIVRRFVKIGQGVAIGGEIWRNIAFLKIVFNVFRSLFQSFTPRIPALKLVRCQKLHVIFYLTETGKIDFALLKKCDIPIPSFGNIPRSMMAQNSFPIVYPYSRPIFKGYRL